MTTSELNKILDHWNRQANGFDAIYTGHKPAWARFLDRWLGKDMYQRFVWVMEHSRNLQEKRHVIWGAEVAAASTPFLFSDTNSYTSPTNEGQELQSKSVQIERGWRNLSG